MRANSPIDDEDHFEFVDYTAASQWERFITTVEEVLNGWGVNNGQLGIFDESRLPPLGDESTTKMVEGIDPFVKREIIVLDENSYTLSYHYHPIKRWNEFIGHSSTNSSTTTTINNNNTTSTATTTSSTPTTTTPTPTTSPPITTLFPSNSDPFLPSSEFLPITLPNPFLESKSLNLNKIHRWTGLTHILVLTPDVFSNYTSLDLNTTKMLISSFAIAFHNMKCKLPVFVPTGQISNSLYGGYMCLFNKYFVKNVSDAGEIELRFNTTLLRNIPSRFSHLTGLTEFFIEKMDLNQIPLDQADVPELDKMPHLGIDISGLFTYELQNLDDNDWKDFDNNDYPMTVTEDIFKEFEGQSVGMFGNGSQTSIDIDISNNNNGNHHNNSNTIITSTSSNLLPFGPKNDPLQSLSLSAFFPSAPCDTYNSELDATKAQIWILSCNFYDNIENQNILLSNILNGAISSFNIDCINELVEKSNNLNDLRRKLSNSFKKKSQIIADLPGSFRFDEYDVLKFSKLQSGGIVDMDDVDIDHILRSLFHPLNNKIYNNHNINGNCNSNGNNNNNNNNNYNNNNNNFKKIDTLSGIQLLSASYLGHCFRDVRTVPYKSFLWNLIENLLGTISSSSDSFLGFLKILWNEILKEIRFHLDRLELLPDVNICITENENGSSVVNNNNNQNDHLSNSLLDDNNSTTTTNNNNIGIDMRFNIIHQKLCMINCCISRLKQNQKYNNNNQNQLLSTSSTSPNSINFQVSSSSNNSLSPDSINNNNINNNNNNKLSKNSLVELQKQSSPDQSYDRIIAMGEDEINAPDSSVILVPSNSNSNSNGAANYSPKVITLIEKEIKSPIQNVHPPISNVEFEEFSNAIQEATSTPLRIPKKRSVSQHHRHSNSPTTSLFSEQSDQNSFIQLSYSPSPEFHYEEEIKEVNDENGREGHSYHYNNLKLIKTGEPLFAPVTQDMGFMTEDMIREQEKLLENLGSSEDATRIRAQLQSDHLKSDMQAFKAANPHAVLEDFIRWHSPRDWISDDSGDPNKGTLSPRMKVKGNLWQDLWKSSKRIPAKRQEPLFKCTGEAEKALHYLEQLPVRVLFKELLPTIFLIAYDTLVSQSVSKNVKPVTSNLAALAQELLDFPWGEIGHKNIACDELIQSFRQSEMLIGKAISLLRKLPKQYDLVERLLEVPETRVSDGKERESVHELFASASLSNDSFPYPTTREFVLQATCLRPTSVPTRMYVSLDHSGMRMVDMVGKDTIFM